MLSTLIIISLAAILPERSHCFHLDRQKSLRVTGRYELVLERSNQYRVCLRQAIVVFFTVDSMNFQGTKENQKLILEMVVHT